MMSDARSLFQFPSNGKADPKNPSVAKHFGLDYQVSIPFKRESGSKDELIQQTIYQDDYEFQFPSNGKADPKLANSETGYPVDMRVSIPFKRESGSKVNGHHIGLLAPNKFQFPSNGKADPKTLLPVSHRMRHQRLGFNSLQTGKRIQRQKKSGGTVISLCFNSLQTGKRIQSSRGIGAEYGKNKFQFPSNGKAYPKVYPERITINDKTVSIPFKRESGSKDLQYRSLQSPLIKFQFPSNGKAYPKQAVS